MTIMSEWISRPIEAHASWLESRTVGGRSYSRQTKRQYASAFSIFIGWLTSQGLTLLTVQSADIERFLSSRQGRSSSSCARRTSHVYLLEIGRVFELLCAHGIREGNPARPILAALKKERPLKPRNSALVGVDLRRRYIGALKGIEAQEMSIDQVRDHAIALLMIEQGFTLKEVQKLTLEDVSDAKNGWVNAPGHRVLRARRLRLTYYAQTWLLRWLSIRGQIQIIRSRHQSSAGSLWDESSLDEGSRVGEFAQDSALINAPANAPANERASEHLAPHRSRVFVALRGRARNTNALSSSSHSFRPRAVNRIADSLIRQAAIKAIDMAEDNWPAGIVKGPQMLRNICFMNLIEAGMDDESIRDFLGLIDTSQVNWMRRFMGLP